MLATDFEPWQIVTVPDDERNAMKFIVYSAAHEGYHHVGDIRDNKLTTVSGPHLHGAYDYDLDDEDALCFGCASCTEWNCQERGCYKNDAHGKPIDWEPLYNENGKRIVEPITSFCQHIQAVIAFLRKKQEFERQNVKYSEYIGNWVSHFHTEKKTRTPEQ